MVVCDTSVLIDHLRGHEPARRALVGARDAGTRIAGSVLTKVEVLAGVRAGEEAVTRALLGAVEWIEVSDEIAERAGTLAGSYLHSHPGVEVVDYVIAATTLDVGATLWTRNVEHFPMFPGIGPPY